MKKCLEGVAVKVELFTSQREHISRQDRVQWSGKLVGSLDVSCLNEN